MNIPYTTDRIRYLEGRAAQLIAEAAELRAKLRANLGLGNHDGATVYKVKATRIKAYTRKSYTAVRCK